MATPNPSYGFKSITEKQRIYRDSRLAGHTKRESKAIAGYSDNTKASVIETVQLKAQFAKLARRFAPAHKIAQRLAEGMDATRPEVTESEAVVEGKKIKQQTITELPDMKERREYIKLAAEWGGYVDKSKGDSTNVGVSVQVTNRILPPQD